MEIDAAVAAYIDMLQKERRGEAYVKAHSVRALGQILPARSPGSIERKFQNISAILDESGLPWIDGYKPLSNYQDELSYRRPREHGYPAACERRTRRLWQHGAATAAAHPFGDR